MSSFSTRIKEKALEIGFVKAGVAPAAALVEEGDRLKTWLANGFHGEMAWMQREREKRSDPQRLFPGAKSVVVVALNYYTDKPHETAPGKGKISRYAWGDDYHEVVREKLTELLDWIKAEDPAVNGKICVDTAPMMDKAWAARAGLGWIGKHSNLITREVGSWVFIGEILLDVVLDYDTIPVDDHCGTCTACINACPTDAIVEPYVVDSQKCISYATIELRSDELPDQFNGRLDNWFYGCDICQDICPWNRFETPASEPRFEPRLEETAVDLEEVLAWTPEEYAARFRRSAIKRAKLPNLKRNALALKKQNG
ncbi:MAG: tRNA epoxyqueuosine(34) reductase QueG [Pyrinomonadaceae bacterium]